MASFGDIGTLYSQFIQLVQLITVPLQIISHVLIPPYEHSFRSILPHIKGSLLSVYKIDTTQPVHMHANVPAIRARKASLENVAALLRVFKSSSHIIKTITNSIIDKKIISGLKGWHRLGKLESI